MTDLTPMTQDKDDRRDKAQPYCRPRDASTLILVDRAGAKPQVLLGKRHQKHVFMPGKFVFPGGRLEPADRYAPSSSALDPHAERFLMQRARAVSTIKARALALAAVRETYEETGLLLGQANGESKPSRSKLVMASPWRAFAEHRVLPDLASVAFIARAITPPGRPRRFDTRFFAADFTGVAHQVPGMVGEDSELIELAWVPIDDTRQLDLPGITRVVLKELQARIAAGFGHDLPVPLIRMQPGGNPVKEWL